MVKDDEYRQCQFCTLFLKKEEYHDEFDYFVHPSAKETLIGLRSKLSLLPENERLYELENYAYRVKASRHSADAFKMYPEIGDGHEILKDGDKIHKRPHSFGLTVANKDYDRLISAYKWLEKLESVPKEPQQSVL